MLYSRTEMHPSRRALEERRLRAAELFGQGLTQGEVARQLGASTSAVSRWYHTWCERGAQGLRSLGRSGPAPRLSPAQQEALVDTLGAGARAAGYATDLWTLPRIRLLIQERFGVRYHVSHVWLLMRRLGWSCQKPQKRARQRDEEAICRWVQGRWQELKGGLKPRA